MKAFVTNAVASVLCLIVAGLFSPAAATAIDLVLQKHPEYSSFAAMLNISGITKRSIDRTTTTVLAVSNDQLGDLKGKADDVVEKILSNHVLLDYFDQAKFRTMPEKTRLVTTIFQTTGETDGRQGIVNVTRLGVNREIFFRSAVEGAPFTSKLVKEVYKHPFNFSLLQVSNVIYTPGIDSSLNPSPVALPPPVPTPPKRKRPPVASGPGEAAAGPESEAAAAPESEAEAGPESEADLAPADAPAAEGDEVADLATSSASSFVPAFFFAAVMALAGAAF